VANSLLDFVMSVVRDPGIAAQYAANPAQAIADANLSGVTTADVDNLIPVVAESFPSAVQSPGLDPFGEVLGEGFGEAEANVWASGAATAAFDAFDDQLPIQGLDDTHAVVTELVTEPDDILSAVVDSADPDLYALNTPVVDWEQPADTPVAPDAPVTPDLDEHAPQSDPLGFDIFE
jgi:hypothetical protein